MSISSQRLGVVLVASCGLTLWGCGSIPDIKATPASGSPSQASSSPPEILLGAPLDPLFEGKTVQAEHSAPVVGGTLLVTRDERTIVAADPDRDAIFLVDRASQVVTPIVLSRGDEPGRMVEGADGTLFVALRRAGALLEIDLQSATVVQKQAVCASPRGVAYDATSSTVYVACRSGQLLSLDAQTLTRTRTLQLDPDLRDVIVREHDLVVTRFMNAEVMVIAEDGSVSRRARPQSTCGEATVLYRALALPGGKIALAHQLSSTDSVGEGPGGYGAGSSCGGGLVSRVLSTVDTDTPSDAAPLSGAAGAPDGAFSPGAEPVHSAMSFSSSFLLGAGPLDVAFDTQSSRVATIALDDRLTTVAMRNAGIASVDQSVLDRAANLWWGELDGSTITAVRIPGQPVSVAFAAGKYIVQSREPATLSFEDGTSVTLSDESHADSGHQMFHMNSGIGIACASCHPEGGDDGHIWHFPEGLRRTMPLEGGVLERAPFHWDGTLGDMGKLVSAVMVTRMGLAESPTGPQIEALGAFLEQLPNLPPADDLDAAAVKRGESIFRRADVACASCHSGPQFTNNQLADVGTGGSFVTPTLLGVGLRPALFHDGCAKSVVQRFGVCGGTAHGKPELLSADERADLITFLRSL